ncbi:DUF3140 domain-containing protein [Kribbella albertanoniae]|uniref:DUF3140 domain-containing protein n=1 Tax=Kribbella albertanoniae TaxID=1266829 RepID=A0A4R4P840_9ACTN|nr:DUF3140 domain-containing protein [Kribbella albertanoniae]TDC18698.1 DUF3140 domain-containing protein [Kribbella albertanoniae]
MSESNETYDEFEAAVNMTPKQLSKWLETPESKRVGQKTEAGSESVGHRSERRIIELLDTDKADLSDSDYQHMRKVVGYVHRHLKQRPGGDITETDWRYSLMNWGHDPTS